MDLLIEDIRAAMTQDYKPTINMVRTLLKEYDHLAQLCEEQGRTIKALTATTQAAMTTGKLVITVDDATVKLDAAESALSQAREATNTNLKNYREQSERDERVKDYWYKRAQSAEQREKVLREALMIVMGYIDRMGNHHALKLELKAALAAASEVGE